MVEVENYIYFIAGSGGHFFLMRELKLDMSRDSLNEFLPEVSNIVCVEVEEDLVNVKKHSVITSCTNPCDIYLNEKIKVENLYSIICDDFNSYVWSHLLYLGKKYLKYPNEFEHEFDWINNEHNFEKGYLDYKSKLKYLNTFAKNYFPYNYNTYFLNSQDKDLKYYHEQNIPLVKKIVMLLDNKKRFEKVIDFYDK